MTGSVQSEVEALVRQYPLPADVCISQMFTEPTSVNGVVINLAGLAVEFLGECVTGAAASLRDIPIARAYMELQERLSILEAVKNCEPRFALREPWASSSRSSIPREEVFPTSHEPNIWRWARSNGVAVGLTWEDATARARLELVERDRVLRSWYGEVLPTRVALDESLIPSALQALYSFEAYVFGARYTEDVVVGLFGLPRDGCLAPAVHGYAARATLARALEAAFQESLQPLGFLWGEPLPTEAPAPAPTPDFHQDHFLFPPHLEKLRAWMSGEHAQYGAALDACSVWGEPDYVDLTPPRLTSRLFVARALPRGHLPLAFGSRHPMVRQDAPPKIWVHPVC